MCRGDRTLSTDPQRRKEVLDGERAVNETYIQKLEARFGKGNPPIAVPLNTIWTNNVPINGPAARLLDPSLAELPF